ncbi:MAG TPA: hypothetical protein VF175_02650 [Lacipirellula sp.]
MIASLLTAAVLTGVAQADQLNPAYIPQDAKWVFHVDAEKLTSSAFAERFREKHAEKAKRARQWLKERYGIDPQDDLRSITLFSNEYAPHTGTVILTADYDAAKVKEILEGVGASATDWEDRQVYTHTVPTKKHDQKHAKGAKKDKKEKYKDKAHAAGDADRGKAKQHDGADDESSAAEKPKKEMASKSKHGRHKDGKHGKKTVATILFNDETIIFATDVERAKAAVRLLEGEADSLENADSKLITDYPTGAIMYGAAVDLDELSQKYARPFPVLSKHEHVNFAFGQRGDELYDQLTLVAKDRDVAHEMEDVLEGFVSLVKVCASDIPSVVDLYDDVEIDQDGATVTVRWEGTVDDVMNALDDIHPRLAEWKKMHHKRHHQRY